MANGWGTPFAGTSIARGSFLSGQLFGKHPGGEFRQNGFHNGLDFGSIDHPGNEVRSVHDGKVIYVGNPGIAGLGALVIVIQSAGINIVYQEFASSTANARVKTGDTVTLGQVIGIRNTEHLHLGMTRMDWRQAQQYAFTDNGTWLDPLPILTSGTSGGETPTQNKGETTMQCIYSKGKAMYYFTGDKVKILTDPAQVTILKTIYRDNNGKDMPVYDWSGTNPTSDLLLTALKNNLAG